MADIPFLPSPHRPDIVDGTSDGEEILSSQSPLSYKRDFVCGFVSLYTTLDWAFLCLWSSINAPDSARCP
jgi:hypothetical protein